MSNPGSAGLTADRLGDSNKWVPLDKKASNSPSDNATLAEPVRVDKTSGSGST
jgi:hypothetical protein